MVAVIQLLNKERGTARFNGCVGAVPAPARSVRGLQRAIMSAWSRRAMCVRRPRLPNRLGFAGTRAPLPFSALRCAALLRAIAATGWRGAARAGRVLNATRACRLSHTTWRWRRSDDVALLEGFCVFAAIAIANARLHTGAAAEPEQLARA